MIVVDDVYIIFKNDGLLTDEVYSSFDTACHICEIMTGFKPTEADKLYEIEPMFYIRIKSMGFA